MQEHEVGKHMIQVWLPLQLFCSQPNHDLILMSTSQEEHVSAFDNRIKSLSFLLLTYQMSLKQINHYSFYKTLHQGHFLTDFLILFFFNSFKKAFSD